AVVAELLRRAEHAGPGDLTGPRLVAAGVVGDLQVADLVEALLEPPAEVTFGDLHVVQVPVDLDVRRADALADRDGRCAAVQAVAGMVDADVHRLEDQRDTGVLDGPRDPLQAGDDRIVHRLLGDAVAVVAAVHG